MCVCVDHFTKFALAVIPLKNMEGEPLANLLQNQVILKYGPPESWHTNNGTEVTNKNFRELLEHYSVKHTRSQPYKSQSLGACERLNHTIRKMIMDYMKANKTKQYVHILPELVYLVCI